MKQIITAIEVVSMLRPVYFFILNGQTAWLIHDDDRHFLSKNIGNTIENDLWHKRGDGGSSLQIWLQHSSHAEMLCRWHRWMPMCGTKQWGTLRNPKFGRRGPCRILICDIFDPISAISRISPIFNFWVEAIVRCMRFLQDGPLFWMWHCKHKTTM